MITVVPMNPAYLDGIYTIECDSFSDPWPKEDILHEMKAKHAVCFVALEHDNVVGYVTMRHFVNEGHICNIAVDENHRKKGIGAALLTVLIEAAKAHEMMGLTLEVRIGNRAAMALYHKFGFKVEGYRRGYYSYPTEDAAIMWKYIEEHR